MKTEHKYGSVRRRSLGLSWHPEGSGGLVLGKIGNAKDGIGEERPLNFGNRELSFLS